MNCSASPFWEKAYQDDNAVAFSMKPNVTLREFENLLNSKSRIIEAGCGEGQNVLYLAKQGYQYVEAFDLSEHAIEKVRRRCSVDGLTLNAFTADLAVYRFDKTYDMVMSFGTLHFVEKDVWKSFINRAKSSTNAGGFHIMQIFTDAVPPSADIAPFAVGLAKDGEIKELYKDWEILQFKSYVFEDEHPDVPKHLHASNKIVARKL